MKLSLYDPSCLAQAIPKKTTVKADMSKARQVEVTQYRKS